MAAAATDALLSEIYKTCDVMTLPLQTQAAAVTATEGDGAAKSTKGQGDVNGEKSEKPDGKGDRAPPGEEDDCNVGAEGADGETHGDGGDDDEGNDDDEDDDDAVPDDDEDDDGEDEEDDDGEDEEEVDEDDEEEEEDDEAPPPPAAKKLKK